MATNTTVYVGGTFTSANGVSRARLAAFNATNGALLSWAPVADNAINGLVMTPDNSRVIASGAFDTLNGASSQGMGSLDAITGAMFPFAATQVIKDSGPQSGILSLSTDGTSVYGTGWSYGPGNFEGVFSANPYTGNLNWTEDCHGDTYGLFPSGSAVYVVSHEHFCCNVGGFPDTNPRSAWHRTTAFSVNATGTLTHNQQSGCCGYGDFFGQPAPSMINWFPTLPAGTYTGQDQAAWAVTGDSQYVVEGGEFPSVNGVTQQGLVRFAVPALAPRKHDPKVPAGGMPLTATTQPGGAVKLSWTALWDQDDTNLSYTVTRDGTPIYSTVTASQFWNLPALSYADAATAGNTTYRYVVKVDDQDNNAAQSAAATVTTPAGPTAPPTAAFSTGGSGLRLTVDGSTSHAATGSITSYAWTFGDGATGSGVTTAHNYASAGTYTVTLTVTDSGGRTGTTSRAITVSGAPVNQAPVASFTATPTNLTVAFNAAASSDADGSVTAYAWNFGDGATASGVTTSHTYAVAGTYTATLTVTDNGGATARPLVSSR